MSGRFLDSAQSARVRLAVHSDAFNPPSSGPGEQCPDMNANQLDIARLLRANDGIIARRDCPQLQDSLAHLVSTGRLRTVLPGVYADLSRADQALTRMRATHLWPRDSILTHEAAAKLTFWPDLPSATSASRCGPDARDAPGSSCRGAASRRSSS